MRDWTLEKTPADGRGGRSAKGLFQRSNDFRLVRGQREVAGIFDDDQALLRSRDLVEIRLDERRRRKEIVPPLDDVVGDLEAGCGGGKVRRHGRFNQGWA